MSRLMSDSESDSEYTKTPEVSQQWENIPSTSNSQPFGQSFCFPPNCFQPFPMMNPLMMAPMINPMANAMMTRPFMPMQSMMPMIVPQNSLENVMQSLQSGDNQNDANKCFFFVMPVSATDLKNNLSMISSFNESMKNFQWPPGYQNQQAQFYTNPMNEKLKIKDVKSKKKIKRRSQDNDLFIIDKIPVLKLTKVDNIYNITNKKISLKELSSKVEYLKEQQLPEVDPWVGSCVACMKTFDDLKSLKKHINKFHSHKQIFCCEICGKSFWLKKWLEKHEKNQHNNDELGKLVISDVRSYANVSPPPTTPEKETKIVNSYNSSKKSEGGKHNLRVNVNKSNSVMKKKKLTFQIRKSQRVLEAVSKSNSKLDVGNKNDDIIDHSDKSDNTLIVSVSKVTKGKTKLKKSIKQEVKHKNVETKQKTKDNYLEDEQTLESINDDFEVYSNEGSSINGSIPENNGSNKKTEEILGNVENNKKRNSEKSNNELETKQIVHKRLKTSLNSIISIYSIKNSENSVMKQVRLEELDDRRNVEANEKELENSAAQEVTEEGNFKTDEVQSESFDLKQSELDNENKEDEPINFADVIRLAESNGSVSNQVVLENSEQNRIETEIQNSDTKQPEPESSVTNQAEPKTVSNDQTELSTQTKIFKSRNILQSQQQANKNKSTVAQCHSCEKVQKIVQDLYQGMAYNNMYRMKVKCPVCPKQFNNVPSIERHLSTIHWNCIKKKKCPLLFINGNFQKKKRIVFSCSICKKLYISDSSLRSHMEYIHKIKSKILLHKLTHPTNRYKKLNPINKDEQDKKNTLLVKTEKTMATTNDKKTTKNGNLCDYHCLICDVTFIGKDSYFDHITFYHNTISDERNITEINIQKYLKLVDTPFNTTNTKNIICSICGEIFKNKTMLCEHHQLHHNNYNYMCSLCCNAYVQKQEIIKHMPTHKQYNLKIITCKENQEEDKTKDEERKTCRVEVNEVKGNPEKLNGPEKLNTNPTGLTSDVFDMELKNSEYSEIESINSNWDPKSDDTIILKRKHQSDEEEDDSQKDPKLPKKSFNIKCKHCEKLFDNEKIYNEHLFFFHDEFFTDNIVKEFLKPLNDEKDDPMLTPVSIQENEVKEAVQELVDITARNYSNEKNLSDKIEPNEKLVRINSIVNELKDKEVNGWKDDKSKNKDKSLGSNNTDDIITISNSTITSDCTPSIACDKCKETFQQQNLLLVHKFIIHHECLIHICENCSQVITSVAEVNEHVCTNVRIFICQLCEKQFKNAFFLNQHNLKFHRETKDDHICKNCGKSFLTNRMKEKHERVMHLNNSETDNKVVIATETSEGTEYVECYLIPIGKQIISLNDQIMEMDKFINHKNYLKVQKNLRFNCKLDPYSPERSVFSKKFCTICHWILKDTDVNIIRHYVQKHVLEADFCHLCGSVFHKMQEIWHMIQHVRTDDGTNQEQKRNLNLIDATNKFIEILKPSSLISIFLYRIIKDRATAKCIICAQTFSSVEDAQKHFLNEHDKMCVLCNISFMSSSLAANHKVKHHVSQESYLWFINRASTYFAHVVQADDYLTLEKCMNNILGRSHELKVFNESQKQHAGSCKRYLSVDRVCALMRENIEGFGSDRKNETVLLVKVEDIINYKDNIKQLAISISQNANDAESLSIKELTKILEEYLRSL